MRERADKVLVTLGFARSRSHARDLIKRNLVKFNDNLLTKAGHLVEEEGLEVLEKENVVGRGALKIKSFLDQHPIDFKNKLVADIGASTGGFTQMALQAGAQKVFAVDVGHNQLAQELIDDPRVINMEGTNAKNEFHFPSPAEVMTVDLSFISTTTVLENLSSKLAEDAFLLVLFKPQFEVGAENLGSKALVNEESAVLLKLNCFLEESSRLGLMMEKILPCGLKGKKSGNQEFFVLLSMTNNPCTNEEIKELP